MTGRGQAIRVRGETARLAERARGGVAMFEALGVPDFRRLWWGSLISNVGTWMQMLGGGWLMLQLTDSPFWLGLAALARAVPVLAFSLFAGVVADRVDRRRLLLFTEGAAGALALALALLTSFGLVRPWHLLAFSALSATVMAFDIPAWQAMIPDLVGKERLMNAIGLNSAAFNAAAVVGPALAGLVIGAFGVAGCFYLNAASFLAVLWALWRIETRCVGADCRRNLLESVGEGLRFIFRRRLVFALFWLATVANLLGRPYQQLMPIVARDVLGGQARTYGLLMAASGAGALVGALLTAALGQFGRKGLLLLGSTAFFGLGLIAFAFTRHLVVALGLLVLIGAGTTLYMGATSTLLQTVIADEVRGRVMSVYSLILVGIMPFGGMVLGSAASLAGSVIWVIAAGGAIVVLSALAVAAVVPALRRAD